MNVPFNIKDAQNNTYTAIKMIGEGTQGRTYLLEGGKYIAKLFWKDKRCESMRSTINYLINLGLNKKCHAVPLREVVSPACGYIAEFASGMMPMSELKWTEEVGSLSEWYKKTGGTQRIYGILTNLAYILRTLHSQGLTYCDLSPNNIFVSNNTESNAVFLIDMDNVRHKTGIAKNIYTPFYGAPEVVSFKSPNTPMSDSFSFAVIAFELLTLSHPLIGDYVSEGEPELEEKALKGELPWIEDYTDDINSCSTGFSSSVFVTPVLKDLFHRVFEEGLNDPDKRPDMYEWYDALGKSMNNLLMCPSCEIFYPYDSKHKCTLCDKGPKKVSHVSMKCWNDIGGETPKFALYNKVWEDILIDNNTPKVLTTEHFLCSKSDIPEKLLELKMLEDKDGKSQIRLTPLNNNEFYLYRQSGDPFDRLPLFSNPIKVSINPDMPRESKLMLSTQELKDSFQRVMTID